jgi:hypothetical protein
VGLVRELELGGCEDRERKISKVFIAQSPLPDYKDVPI